MRSHYLVLILAVVCLGNRAAAQPEAERAVLVEFFNATNGPAWTNKNGWLGPGSVCHWHGVFCDYLDGDQDKPVVAGLSLTENNLSGTVPASLARLPHLKSLSIELNRLRGDFPPELLRRWDNHEFELRWLGNLFRQQLTAVKVSQVAGGLCSATEDINFAFEVVGYRASLQSIRCSDAKQGGTYCVVKQGTAFGLDRLARALTELHVQDLESQYTFPPGTFQTHAATVTTNWTWGDGSTKGLSTYGGQGPLRAWMAQQLTVALLADASWDRETRKAKCDFDR